MEVLDSTEIFIKLRKYVCRLCKREFVDKVNRDGSVEKRLRCAYPDCRAMDYELTNEEVERRRIEGIEKRKQNLILGRKSIPRSRKNPKTDHIKNFIMNFSEQTRTKNREEKEQNNSVQKKAITFVCRKCDIVYHSVEALERHRERRHQNEIQSV